MKDRKPSRRVRRSRSIRLIERSPRYSLADQTVLCEHRVASLGRRTQAEISAGETLGLAAMNSIALTDEQRNFLQALVRTMGAPPECILRACRDLKVCTDARVQCYWRNREHVRAIWPQVDDVLLRMVCPVKT